MVNPYKVYNISVKANGQQTDVLTGIVLGDHVNEYMYVRNSMVNKGKREYGLHAFVNYPLLNNN